ncbi:MAG: hypothetical protein RL634_312 [Bacteroidota bacterium]|jgi:hypothetical protein
MALFLLNAVTSREGYIHAGNILHILLLPFILISQSGEKNNHE